MDDERPSECMYVAKDACNNMRHYIYNAAAGWLSVCAVSATISYRSHYRRSSERNDYQVLCANNESIRYFKERSTQYKTWHAKRLRQKKTSGYVPTSPGRSETAGPCLNNEDQAATASQPPYYWQPAVPVQRGPARLAQIGTQCAADRPGPRSVSFGWQDRRGF